MTEAQLLATAVSLPFLGALGVMATGRRPNLREGITLVASVLTFATVLQLLPGVLDGARPELELATPFPGVRLAFELEPLGMLYALVASGLWIVTSLYAIGYMRGHHEGHQTRFFAYFAISITAALGVAFSANLLTLFVFYEMLTLCTYPLVTHRGTAEAIAGGRTYLGVLLTTSVAFLLFAILWTGFVAGTLEFTPGGILDGKIDGTAAAVLLGLYAFGIGKAALMPFHRWLPAAMVAPAPVSALLHAVAVVKAGVFSVLKIVVYIFGIDFLSEGDLSVWLMYAAATSVLVASVIAVTRDNLKARLAYSTISQLGYIVLGAALATPASIVGGGMHIAMHAVGKITLFFCAGAIDVALHKQKVSELDGIGRQMPFTMIAFAVASLSIIGIPPLGGSWSKWYLALGAADANQGFFVFVLMASSLLSIAYLMPIVGRAFFRPLPGAEPNVKPTLKEAPLLCVVPLCLTAVGSVALFFAAPQIRALLLPLVGE